MLRFRLAMAKKESHTIEFISLLTQHQMGLRGFIISLLPGCDEVNDILQETNIVLWKKRKHFKAGTNFKAWAFTVAKNKVKQYQSKLYKAGKRNALIAENDNRFINAVADAQSVILDTDHELRALELCMQSLSEQERELVSIRYASRYGLKQYAEKIGSSAEYLRVSLSRIRAKLKTCIEKRMFLEGITK